jgi:hypothetical protein
MLRESVRFGEHEGLIEEPDLVVVRFHGGVEGDELAAMFAWHRAFAQDLAHYFILYDLRSVGTVAAAALRVFRDLPPSPTPATTMLVGGAFSLRVAVEMIARARSMLGRRHRDPPLRSFDTEKAARAYIDKARREGVP